MRRSLLAFALALAAFAQTPPQPNQASYPVTSLYRFPIYHDRAAYQQATKEQAPQFDPKMPIKAWEDPQAIHPVDGSLQPRIYLVFDPSANPATYRMPVPASAARVNLPGEYRYPAYVAPATDAVQYGPYGPIGPASPDVVCLQSDAQQVANELAKLYNQPAQVLEANTGVYHLVYGKTPSRQWNIDIGSNSWNAQALIAGKNGAGVGAPGHWALTPLLTWVRDAAVTAAPANAITLPVPIRELLPNETLAHTAPGLFSQSGTWVVNRSDMAKPVATPAQATDQQFADIKALLEQILARLTAAGK